MYSCHLFLISSAFVRSIQFQSFIVPIFAWNIPLVSLIFLKRSLVFTILLFSSTSFHWSLRKAFLYLLASLWNCAFKCVYLSFSPLPLASLLFSAICNASSDNHFAFLHFLYSELFLIRPWLYSINIGQVSSAQSLSHVDSLESYRLQQARPPCPSPTPRVYLNSCPLKLVMTSNHLILCHFLLLLPSIFPYIRVFSNESVLCIR